MLTLSSTVFEPEEFREQATAVVEKTIHHGPEPVGEPGVEVGQIEHVTPSKVEHVTPSKVA